MSLSSPRPWPLQVLPLAPNRLLRREQAALATDRWIDLLARQQGMHRLELLHLLRSRHLLARDVAKLIAESNLAEGDRLFEADEPPPDGDSLGEQIARAQWERRTREAAIEWAAAIAYNAEDDALTQAGFAQLRALQAAQEAAQEQEPMTVITEQDDGTITTEVFP